MTGNGLSRQNKVKMYATEAAFPTVGRKGVWYFDESTGTPYIWDGTAYQDVDPLTDDIWEKAAGVITAQVDGDDLDMETGDVTATNITADTQITVGTNTEITEPSGDTLIENTSATNDMLLKLGDAAAATSQKVVDSADTRLHEVVSDGTVYAGKSGEAGVVEVNDAADVAQIKLNSSGNSFINFSLGLGTETPVAGLDINKSMGWKVRTIAASTGTIAITDNVIVIDYTTTGTVALDLPSAATAWNTDGTGMVFTIMDKDANANTNNITISRAGADTIIDEAAAQTSTVLDADGGVLRIMPISTTEWKVF